MFFSTGRSSITLSMRHLAALGALCFLATGSLAHGPDSSLGPNRTDRFIFFFERVDLLVTVTNAGDNDLVLDNNEGHPWLSFLVSKH